MTAIDTKSAFFPLYQEALKPRNNWESFVRPAVSSSPLVSAIHQIALAVFSLMVAFATLGIGLLLAEKIYRTLNDYQERLSLTVQAVRALNKLNCPKEKVPDLRTLLQRANLSSTVFDLKRWVKELSAWQATGSPIEKRDLVVQKLLACLGNNATVLDLKEFPLRSLPPLSHTLFSLTCIITPYAHLKNENQNSALFLSSSITSRLQDKHKELVSRTLSVFHELAIEAKRLPHIEKILATSDTDTLERNS